MSAAHEAAAREQKAREHTAHTQTARIVWRLVSDLLSLPFHLIQFCFTRAKARRDFQRALKDAAP